MSRDIIKKPITNLAEGQAYLAVLHAEGLAYHLEDDPTEVVWGGTSAPPDWDEMAQMRLRARELYELDWGEHGCPLGYLMDVLEQTERDD